MMTLSVDDRFQKDADKYATYIETPEAGVAERVSLRHGDAAELSGLFDAGSLDLILRHNVLEFVVDPLAVLRCATRALRDAGLISILVRNRPGEVLKTALVCGDLAAADSSSCFSGRSSVPYPDIIRLEPRPTYRSPANHGSPSGLHVIQKPRR